MPQPVLHQPRRGLLLELHRLEQLGILLLRLVKRLCDRVELLDERVVLRLQLGQLLARLERGRLGAAEPHQRVLVLGLRCRRVSGRRLREAQLERMHPLPQRLLLGEGTVARAAQLGEARSLAAGLVLEAHRFLSPEVEQALRLGEPLLEAAVSERLLLQLVRRRVASGRGLREGLGQVLDLAARLLVKPAADILEPRELREVPLLEDGHVGAQPLVRLHVLLAALPDLEHVPPLRHGAHLLLGRRPPPRLVQVAAQPLHVLLRADELTPRALRQLLKGGALLVRRLRL
mmetsp:Transcript_3848/g.11618  ORF Transcript_3848/g.11618 Transcript_3848/m.11618 type:complete len:289 (-) Transcript_3848:55-921(-)